jgi:hypothetical protein
MYICIHTQICVCVFVCVFVCLYERTGMLGRHDGSPPYAHFALFIAEFHACVHKYNQCQKKLDV